MKLSHSAATLYLECPFKYKLTYIDRIKTLEESSALTFGQAVDKAFAAMLIPGDKTPEQVFLEEWAFDKIMTGNQKFSKSDLDLDLITVVSSKSDDELTFYSLRSKGLLMIKALQEKVMPNIEKVLAVQAPISLKASDDSGDEFIGFIDLIVNWKGYKEPVIMDLKTTSVKYEADSVKKSPQLTVYTYAEGDKYKTKTAGFIVLNKKIKKTRTKTCKTCGFSAVNSRFKTCNNEINDERCGGEFSETVEFDVDVNVIIDQVDEKFENETLDSIDGVHAKIKACEFPQNKQNCIHPVYRKPCAFYKLCHENSMEGLVIKDERK